MDACSEFFELAQHLNQERLFVASEKQHLQNLHEQVQKTIECLFHVAWIAKQQRINLDGLILSKPNSTPSACCHRANILEGVNFVDSYKHLSINEIQYGEFLQALRNNPGLVAMCLAAGQKLSLEAMPHIVSVLVDSIYGHCMLQEDEQLVLQVLKHLMEMQLATNDNPRRLLRHGTCAFGRVYKVFNEGLFSAKLFLTGALHDAIMNLLMEDELFLDIDPSKAVVRFPLHERQRRFGKEGTVQYTSNLQKYRNWTINKLVNLANKFIAGIRNNLYCFPSSLLWLVKQLYNMVMKARKVEVREVGAMCADLVFAFFICPAIVNPEPYGICDAPISYIARFNLMQVAQILQVLAMAKWEELDPKLMDLYGKFEKDCMSSLLDFLLEGGVDDLPPSANIHLQGLVRTAVLVTESDLQCLIKFLQHVQNNSTEEWVDHKALQRILSILPPSIHSKVTDGNTLCDSPEASNSSFSLTPTSGASLTPASKKTLLGKVGKNRHKGPSGSSLSDADHPSPQNQHNHLHHPHHHHHHHHHHRQGEGDESPAALPCDIEDVLVISLNVSLECPGMLAEHKILSLEQTKHGKVRMKLEGSVSQDDDSVPGGEMQEKRTRFSLSHDQDSIGNTSDNLEAVSEAASNHSVTSSLELENDNLSDMISANVSGRGTPNVSGRDTPSSQVEGEEREQRTLDLPVTAQKQNREDISDKFGKFEIKTLIEGDETVSMVSDTWSTDVLASDSETVEQGERPLEDVRLVGRSGMLDVSQAVGIAGSFGGSHSRGVNGGTNVLDVTETGSEAWSTDVMASDSERLHEVDTDDTGSIARSDDTASLTRSDNVLRVDPLVTASSDTQADILLRVDLQDHGDENITPRASGSHSPVEGPSIGSGPSGSWLSTLHAAAGFKPIVESRGTSAFKPGAELHSSKVQHGEDRNHVSPIVLHKPVVIKAHGSKEIEVRRKNGKSKGNKTSESYKYKQDKVVNSRNSFESLVLRSSSLEGFVYGAIETAMDDAYIPPSDDISSSEIMGMQSLGRLSLAMEELPDNGIIPPDVPSLLNTQNSVSSIADSAGISESELPSDVDVFMELPSTNCHRSSALPAQNQSSFDLMDDTPLSPTAESEADLVGRMSAGDDVIGSPFLSPMPSCSNNASKLCNGKIIQLNNNKSDIYSYLEPSCNGTERPKKNRSVNDADIVAARLSNASLGSSSSSSNCSASGEVNVHVSVTESQVMESPIPTASSGAIPKSISFDKTAEKGDKESFDEDSKGRKSFFKSFKLTLKRPSRKSARYHDETHHYDKGGSDFVKDDVIGDFSRHPQMTDAKSPETSDDILAKYRKKTAAATTDESLYSCARPHNNDIENVSSNKRNGHPASSPDQHPSSTNEDDQPAVSSRNFEESYAFVDAKRKLRLVLSTADPKTAPWPEKSLLSGKMKISDNKNDNKLVAFLKTQLAEAINLQDRSLTAQLHETLRCVSVFDKPGCKKLFRSLKDDYKNRYPYIAYLIRCRQGLLSALSHLERLLKRVERDKAVCCQFMISVCVRFFLERQEKSIHTFFNDFQKLTVSDEKTEFVEKFLLSMYQQMQTDPIWQGASQVQVEQAKNAIECSIMSQIYIHALYPNGDGDVHRDQVLHEHIQKLSKIITPDHKDLKISKIYHYECPWPSAQAEIKTINAYKTPSDKLQCVVRCCTTIMNLLSMANHRSVPAADDFIPVLVYIIIKANPGNLLSTIQYVNSFYQKELKGEDEYWWIQFCSAVEFIKTMDYAQ